MVFRVLAPVLSKEKGLKGPKKMHHNILSKIHAEIYSKEFPSDFYRSLFSPIFRLRSLKTQSLNECKSMPRPPQTPSYVESRAASTIHGNGVSTGLYCIQAGVWFGIMRNGGAITPPTQGVSQRYLGDTIGRDTPLCDTISKRYCAIWGGILTHRNRSDVFCDLRLRCPSQTPEIARFPRQDKEMLHCDLRARCKVASDLRFRAAISEPKTSSFCRISSDLAP